MSHKVFDKIELSSLLTVIGIILLFSTAVGVTLIAPPYLDKTWVESTSPYQVQMYEVADPNIYFSIARSNSSELQAVYHLQKDKTLLAFRESESVRIIAPKELEKFITHVNDSQLKLTSQLLLLRKPKTTGQFEGEKVAKAAKEDFQAQWKREHPNWKEEGKQVPAFNILELYQPDRDEAFAVTPIDRIIEDWVDKDFTIVDEQVMQSWHKDPGVIYVNNPEEFLISKFKFGSEEGWRYDPERGQPVDGLEQLKSTSLGFQSRKELIEYGEHIYTIEGCWYCHTDQTRTLVQDVVLNGSDSYPAPPSSANEYIYQKITFPGTRRIGPDLSRVGIKRPSRDWHQSHFWAPKTESPGSIMPAFQHFFDFDPRGTKHQMAGVPNHQFEAVFQYLMTKGTRITPPTEAWWLGKDPVNTKEIIEGRKKIRG